MLYQQPPQPITNPLTALVQKQEQPKPPEPVTYTIKDGDVLEKVALDQHTTVQKLFNKNVGISDPNIIEVGQTLVIPADSEVLTERPYFASIEDVVKQKLQLDSPRGSFSVSGNLYAAGNCTQYAKNRRPDLSNSLGNADMWLINAKTQGFSTGVTPKVGSIAVARSYMHVAYVEKVEGDRVFVSEQNYVGYGIISSRWTPVSEWQGYIY